MKLTLTVGGAAAWDRGRSSGVRLKRGPWAASERLDRRQLGPWTAFGVRLDRGRRLAGPSGNGTRGAVGVRLDRGRRSAVRGTVGVRRAEGNRRRAAERERREESAAEGERECD